jgi:hypothetical protein
MKVLIDFLKKALVILYNQVNKELYSFLSSLILKAFSLFY